MEHNEKKEALGERHARAAERAAKRRCAEVDDDSVSVSDVESGTDVQTTLTLDELTSIEARLENLEGKMAQLKNRLVKAEKEMTEMKLDEVAFCNNDEKVNFYTGLPTWQILSILLDHIQASLLEHSSLTPFQQLLMTLMRLRMNMSGQDLAYRFGVHKSTISRIFSHVIDVLYVMLKPLFCGLIVIFYTAQCQWISASIAPLVLSSSTALRYFWSAPETYLQEHRHIQPTSTTTL